MAMVKPMIFWLW